MNSEKFRWWKRMVRWCVERVFRAELAAVEEAKERAEIAKARADRAAELLEDKYKELDGTLSRFLTIRLEVGEMRDGPGVMFASVVEIPEASLVRLAKCGGRIARCEYYAHAIAEKIAPQIENEIAKRIGRERRR